MDDAKRPIPNASEQIEVGAPPAAPRKEKANDDVPRKGSMTADEMQAEIQRRKAVKVGTNAQTTGQPVAEPEDSIAEADDKYQKGIEGFLEQWKERLAHHDSKRPLPQLAMVMQRAFELRTKDERAKMEDMPWTQYFHAKETEQPMAKPAPPKGYQPPRAQSIATTVCSRGAPLSTIIPTVDATPVDKFTLEIYRLDEEWDKRRAGCNDKESLRRLVKIMQRAFEIRSDDTRAYTRTMPWTKYLKDDAPPKAAVSQPRKLAESRKSLHTKATKDNDPELNRATMTADDFQYYSLKNELEEQWPRLLGKERNKEIPMIDKLAMVAQQNFNNKANDERSMMENMPWTEFLPADYFTNPEKYKLRRKLFAREPQATIEPDTVLPPVEQPQKPSASLPPPILKELLRPTSEERAETSDEDLNPYYAYALEAFNETMKHAHSMDGLSRLEKGFQSQWEAKAGFGTCELKMPWQELLGPTRHRTVEEFRASLKPTCQERTTRAPTNQNGNASRQPERSTNPVKSTLPPGHNTSGKSAVPPKPTRPPVPADYTVRQMPSAPAKNARTPRRRIL